MQPQANLLSVILPTYNEADNLPIIIWLLVRELRERRRAAPRCCVQREVFGAAACTHGLRRALTVGSPRAPRRAQQDPV